MTSALWFFSAVTAIVFVGFVALSVFEAVRDYRQDKWARGNWALRFWWRYLSHTHAARQRRWELLGVIGLLTIIPGLPLAWIAGAGVAWQAGHLEAYMEWTQKLLELTQKGIEVIKAFR